VQRRALLTTALLVLVCALSSAAGSAVAMRAAGPAVTTFTLGKVESRVEPSLSGRFDAYVPIVDWGVRAAPFEAPVEINVRFRSLDRGEARAALRSGPAARTRLDSIRTELAEVGRNALERAAVLGIAGGLTGGLLAGGLIGAVLHRRRWLAYGARGRVAADVGRVDPHQQGAHFRGSFSIRSRLAHIGARGRWVRGRGRYVGLLGRTTS
jgi:hypothetical protein